MNVSIDMSKDDETAQNRIFAEVVEKQTTNDGDVTLLCDFDGANYDFDNHKKISELQSKLDIAVSALEDIGYCKSRIMLNYPDRLVHWALEALAKIKEIK